MKSAEIRDEVQKEHNKFQQLSHESAELVGVRSTLMLCTEEDLCVPCKGDYNSTHTHTYTLDDDEDGGGGGGNACFTHIYRPTHTCMHRFP